MAKKDKVLLRNPSGAGVYLHPDQVERFVQDHPDYAEERADEPAAKAVESAPENKAVTRSSKKRS